MARSDHSTPSLSEKLSDGDREPGLSLYSAMANELACRSCADLQEISLLIGALADAKGRNDGDATQAISELIEHRLNVNTSDPKWLEETEIIPAILTPSVAAAESYKKTETEA